VIIFQTGVGTRALLEAAERLGRREEFLAALAGRLVAVRGPKPAAVLRQAGVRMDVAAGDPSTTAELLTALDMRGGHTTIVAGLPARGDYGVTDLAFSPNNGRLYFGVGAATI